MHAFKPSVLALLSATALLSTGPSRADDITQRLRSEMPRSLTELQSQFQHARSRTVVESISRDVPSRKTSFHSRRVTVRDGRHVVITSTNHLSAGEVGHPVPYERAVGRNADYVFHVQRGGPDTPWVLMGYDALGQPGDAHRLLEMLDACEPNDLAGLRVVGERLHLPEVFGRPGFQLTQTAIGPWPGAR